MHVTYLNLQIRFLQRTLTGRGHGEYQRRSPPRARLALAARVTDGCRLVPWRAIFATVGRTMGRHSRLWIWDHSQTARRSRP